MKLRNQKWTLPESIFFVLNFQTLNIIMNIFKKIYFWFKDIKRQRELKKRIEELRKRDPFIYK